MTGPMLSSYARRSLVGDEGVRRSPLLAVPAVAGVLGKVPGIGRVLGSLGKGSSRVRRATQSASAERTSSRSAGSTATRLLAPSFVLSRLASRRARPSGTLLRGFSKLKAGSARARARMAVLRSLQRNRQG
jgi:hypothetical protein